jgi:hypothetical protein
VVSALDAAGRQARGEISATLHRGLRWPTKWGAKTGRAVPAWGVNSERHIAASTAGHRPVRRPGAGRTRIAGLSLGTSAPPALSPYNDQSSLNQQPIPMASRRGEGRHDAGNVLMPATQYAIWQAIQTAKLEITPASVSAEGNTGNGGCSGLGCRSFALGFLGMGNVHSRSYLSICYTSWPTEQELWASSR